MSYMVEQTFEKIGLSPRETQVYLALLERGQSTGYEISKHLGEKRTTIYYTLEELRKKGLVLKTPHASKHYFTARHPQEVAAEAHKRANELDSLLPYLSGLIKDGERPKLTYYEGIDGFDKIIAKLTKDPSGPKNKVIVIDILNGLFAFIFSEPVNALRVCCCVFVVRSFLFAIKDIICRYVYERNV